MDAVFREMGVSDPTVPKRMQTLYRSFGGRITAYRNALRESEDALAEAVARNVFPDGAGGSAIRGARQLSKGARYAAIAAVELAALRRGAVPFPAMNEEEGSGSR